MCSYIIIKCHNNLAILSYLFIRLSMSANIYLIQICCASYKIIYFSSSNHLSTGWSSSADVIPIKTVGAGHTEGFTSFFLMIISFTWQPGKTTIDSFILNVSNEDAFKMNRLRNAFLILERVIGSEKQCKFYVHEC